VACVRRSVRIWSITAACVMHATIRIGPAQRGHASGSTSSICRSNAAHRRVASVGTSCGVVTIGTRPSAGRLSDRSEPTALLTPFPRARHHAR